MSYQQKLNTATIWENQKQKDTQPDFRGTINVEGKEYDIALWEKTSSGGKRFLGGPIQEPRRDQQKPESQSQRADKTEKQHQQNGGDPFDDSIPFAPHMAGTIV